MLCRPRLGTAVTFSFPSHASIEGFYDVICVSLPRLTQGRQTQRTKKVSVDIGIGLFLQSSLIFHFLHKFTGLKYKNDLTKKEVSRNVNFEYCLWSSQIQESCIGYLTFLPSFPQLGIKSISLPVFLLILQLKCKLFGGKTLRDILHNTIITLYDYAIKAIYFLKKSTNMNGKLNPVGLNYKPSEKSI